MEMLLFSRLYIVSKTAKTWLNTKTVERSEYLKIYLISKVRLLQNVKCHENSQNSSQMWKMLN